MLVGRSDHNAPAKSRRLEGVVASAGRQAAADDHHVGQPGKGGQRADPVDEQHIPVGSRSGRPQGGGKRHGLRPASKPNRTIGMTRREDEA